MLDREQQLVDAAMRYRALLAGPEPVSIRAFVATVDEELREELAEYLELMLAVGEPHEPIILSAAEEGLAERVAERTRDRLQQRLTAPQLAAQSLTSLRNARKLSLGNVARQINLPVDLLARIERGGVLAATVPGKLVTALASVLQQAETDIRAALAAPQLAPTGVRLSAQAGTQVTGETVVSFADALAASSATDAQKAEWA